MRDFHISISWWSFTRVWVTASNQKSPGLFSVFWPFSIIIIIIIIHTSIIWWFSLRLNDSSFPQYFSSLPRMIADFRNVLIWVVSIFLIFLTLPDSLRESPGIFQMLEYSAFNRHFRIIGLWGGFWFLLFTNVLIINWKWSGLCHKLKNIHQYIPIHQHYQKASLKINF